ncbi:MAG: AI-2E family transporter [Rivularia sp. (in: cyanobacteria)]
MSEKRKSFTLYDVLLIIAGFFLVILLWQLRSLVLTLMIATVLAATISPSVDALERLRFPRWLGVILFYLGLIGGLIVIGLLIGPSVSEQIQRLARRFPIYLENLGVAIENLAARVGITQLETIEQFFDLQALTNGLFRSSQKLVLRSFGVTFGILGAAINLILAVVISGYMAAGSKSLIRGLVSVFPQPWDERLEAQVLPISRRMGGYVQGRVLVSLILGIVITVALRILGLSEFALALGTIAAFTNVIPFVGPVLGAIPALIVAIPQGGLTVLWVLLLFVIIQNIESYVLDPLLVGNTVRVHPFYQLLAVLGGTQVLGIIGAVIVPPWVAGIAVVLENLYLRPKLLAEKQLSVSSEQLSVISER